MSKIAGQPLAFNNGTMSGTGNPANLPTLPTTGDLYLGSLGNARQNLGPLITASSRRWHEQDLFEVHASNWALLTDTFIYKICATAGLQSLINIAAPKVAVPNGINTFKGRTMIYEVQPATEVPKRGTVRVQSKRVEEWTTNMTQKGIGSKIEGGAYRTPEGSVFLNQELQAYAMSIELNMALNTAITLVNASIARPFFSGSASNKINAVTFANQVNRELSSFCSGCGDSSHLSSAIASIQLTTPNADIMYLTMQTYQNIIFNDQGPGRDIPNMSISMIEDGDGRRVAKKIVNGKTKSLSSIYGGKINILPMPTFNFDEGRNPFQPLEHIFSTGEMWVLNAERGLKGWSEIEEPSSSNNTYSSKCLNQMIYDHSKDVRTEISFLNSVKYARIFDTDHEGCEWINPDKRIERWDPALVSFMADFNTKYGTLYPSELDETVNDITNNKDKILTYATRITKGAGSTKKDVDIYDLVDRFKRMVQFPLTINVDTKGNVKQTAAGKTAFCLPDKLGDLDPCHLSPTLFRSMVQDTKRQLVHFIQCKEMSIYEELKGLLTSGGIDKEYWELVHQLNRERLVIKGLSKDSNLNVYGYNDTTSSRKGVTKLASDANEIGAATSVISSLMWPSVGTNECLQIPTLDLYQRHLSEKGITQTDLKQYVPQGLWSAAGLRYLATDQGYQTTKYNEYASTVLNFLKCLWNDLKECFPNSIYTHCNHTDHMLFFSNYGSIRKKGTTPTALNDISVDEWEGIQILMNILDEENKVDVYMSLIDEPDNTSSLYQNTTTNTPPDFLYMLSGDLVITPTSKKNNLPVYSFVVQKNNDMHKFVVEGKEALDEESMITAAVVVSRYRHKLNSSNTDLRYNEVFTKPQIIECYKKVRKYKLANKAALTGLSIEIYTEIISSEQSSDDVDDAKISSIYRAIFMYMMLSSVVYYTKNNSTAPAIKKVDIQSLTTKTGNSKSAIQELFEKLFTGYKMSNNLKKLEAFYKDIGDIDMGVTFDSVDGTNSVLFGMKYYLTPFVLYAKQLTHVATEKPGFLLLATREFTSITKPQDVGNIEKKNSGLLQHMKNNIYAKVSKESHTYWFDSRFKRYVGNKYGENNNWGMLERIISAFLLTSQFTYGTVARAIHKDIRPPFDVCIWRTFMRYRFEGILLMASGIQTAFNPFTNAHIGMSRDGDTDQYHIRAVVETDCVVINNQNLAFIPCVRPTGYLGGRGTRFITGVDDVHNLAKQASESVSKMPSLISTITSFGYMSNVEYPVSFINNPIGRVSNNIVDETSKSQHWPGHYYYGDKIYNSLFSGANKRYDMSIGSNDNNSRQLFAKWLLRQGEYNHIAFRGFSVIYDVHEGRYSQYMTGNGHFSKDFMNDQGAQSVFEGRSSFFSTPKRPTGTNFS